MSASNAKAATTGQEKTSSALLVDQSIQNPGIGSPNRILHMAKCCIATAGRELWLLMHNALCYIEVEHTLQLLEQELGAKM